MTPRGPLAYEVSGRGDCVVFCHALATDRRLWESQVAALQSTRKTVTYDLRGHGQSPPARDADYSLASMAGDVISILDSLGVERADLVGISVGGEIAQLLAALYPERVQSLLLSSTACFTPQSRSHLWEARIVAVAREGMESVAAQSVSRWFSADYQRCNPAAVAAWKSRIAATSVEAYVGIARVLQSMDLRREIKGLTCKTHIICGSEDGNTGPEVAQEIAAHIRHATVEIINGVGHFPNVETPARFNRWLVDSLAS